MSRLRLTAAILTITRLRSAKEHPIRLVAWGACWFAFPSGHSWPGQAEELTADFKRIFTTRHGFNSLNNRIFNRSEVSATLHFEAAASRSDWKEIFRSKNLKQTVRKLAPLTVSCARTVVDGPFWLFRMR
jgi:hypothetical protein